MNRIDKAALQGWALIFGAVVLAIAVWGLAYVVITYVPVVFWQVAWAMVKGALPFAVAITIAVWINQRISK